MGELSSRFLDAFSAIEKRLRKLLDADRHMTFNEMAERAARTDKRVRRLRSQLKDFGELRNFSVREYRRDSRRPRPVLMPLSGVPRTGSTGTRSGGMPIFGRGCLTPTIVEV
jgi:hypothetical protein